MAKSKSSTPDSPSPETICIEIPLAERLVESVERLTAFMDLLNELESDGKYYAVTLLLRPMVSDVDGCVADIQEVWHPS